jgi:large subunit ribosomal protein L6
MSRIGNKPVELPKGVTVTVEGSSVKGKGPQGELVVTVPDGISVKVRTARWRSRWRASRPAWAPCTGPPAASSANMVKGLATPYVKELEIQGVGFRAQQQGQKLVLALGFSHPIEFQVPKGITAKVTDSTAITISGADKHLVGETAARIRGFFPAEPYKGKGVRYKGEHVRRKAGKAVA